MSRGRKKTKVRDLSRAQPTDAEHSALTKALIASLQGGSPIVVGILAASAIEFQLEKLIRRRFNRTDDVTWELMTSETGPFRSLYSKTIAAYAFNIIDPKTRGLIDTVRTVRNQFAHAKKIIGFDNELIVEEVKSSIESLPRKARKPLEQLFKTAPDSHIGQACQASFGSIALHVSLSLQIKNLRYLQSYSRRIGKTGKPGVVKDPAIRALLAQLLMKQGHAESYSDDPKVLAQSIKRLATRAKGPNEDKS